MKDTVLEAIQFAIEAHGGQKRKITGLPYIIHPVSVAKIVSDHYDRTMKYSKESMIIAAVLHDVVEDTPVSKQEIYDKFGLAVSLLVEGLTDTSRPEDGNRETRKAMDRDRLLAKSVAVHFIKCADIIDNTKDAYMSTGKFRYYVKEKITLVNAMKDNPLLMITKYRLSEIIEGDKSFGSITKDCKLCL
jgi:(p)ppGpp synthase/HD superfamily hydrolase